jgi:hypothetical protein
MSTKTPETFSFVPHQSGTARPNNDRRFINTHLSRLAAERRKRGKGAPKAIKTSRDSPPSDHAPLAKVAIPRSSPEIVPAIATTQVSEEREQDSDEQPLSEDSPVYPVTLLDNGSHDPFESTLVPITSEARQLLLFDHEMLHPFVVNIEKGADKDGAFGNKFNYTSQAALADECIGYATLARIANAAATVTANQNVKMVALNYKSRAYESLRSSINRDGVRPTEHLLTQIFSLLSMEITGQQHDHAALHAKTLKQLIQNGNHSEVDAETMNKKLLSSILWHECLRGAFALCRPAFEIEDLVDHTAFLRTLLGCKDKLTKLGLMPQEPINGFQQAGVSSHLLMRLREYRFLARLCHGLQSFPTMIDEDYMTAFSFRATLTGSKLLDIYNDAYDDIKLRRNDKGKDLTPDYVETATALAAIFWYRVATSHEAVDVPPSTQTQMYKVFGTQKPVLKHLREAFYYCKESGGVTQQPELWLWLLYVGSLAERADLHPQCNSEKAISSYFHNELYEQSRKMGVRTWEAMEEVLFRFLYARKVGPMSKALFRRTM